jgi:ornithine cyclodeaminase/alanine dehydrogenase-like protein (mu-crystallin family)
VPIYLNEQHAAEFVDMPSAVAAVRAAFVAQARGEATNIPRTRLAFGERRLNLMAGGGRSPERYALKSYGSATYHILLSGTARRHEARFKPP